jgi:hypothetical protein
MNKTLFFTAMFLFSFAIAAEQPDKPVAKADFLKTVDKNNDGKVSKEEFFAAMEKKFRSMDVDKSEVISVQELKVYGEKDPEARKKIQQAAQEALPEKVFDEETFIKQFTDRGEKEFAVLDKNHDDKLSPEELGVKKKPAKKNSKTKPEADKAILKEDFVAMFTENAEHNFFQLDKNYDGELTNDELSLSKAQIKLIFPALAEPVIEKKSSEDKLSDKQKIIKSFFVGIDANKDELISNDEKNAAFTRLFNRLDTNHDQFVTPTEIAEGHQTSSVEHP